MGKEDPNAAERPAKKDWDSMTPDEQRTEVTRLRDAEAAASKVDPAFDRSVDQMVRTTGKSLQDHPKVTIMLFQITKAMESEGQKPLPPRECGINGYNYVVPRGIPVEIPEPLAHVLYQAGELNAMQMFQLGLMTLDEVKTAMSLADEEAKKLAEFGQAMPT